jgi:hypothetical protein
VEKAGGDAITELARKNFSDPTPEIIAERLSNTIGVITL